jgi:DNA-binding MarR family transcriptional regulator
MKKEYRIITSDHNTLASNLIHSIDKRTSAIYNLETEKYGLTFMQSLVILYIAQSEKEKIYQIDLEHYLGLKNPSVTSLVKHLIAEDYIYRIKDEQDGRYYHLHLTPKSLAITDDLAACIYRLNKMIQEYLSEDEFQSFTATLEKIDGMLRKEKERLTAEKQ